MQDATEISIAPVVGGSELLSMGLSMVVVVAAILILGWFYSRSRFAGSGATDVINVVATRALGPKERLMIIEVGEQQLLVGMTANAVQMLHVFDTPVRVDTTPADAVGFGGRLSSALQEMRK